MFIWLYFTAIFAVPMLAKVPTAPGPSLGLASGFVGDASLWVHPDVTLDPFYATPDNFSDYEVGDLVKWEDIDAQLLSGLWSVPSGLALSRFFYVSQDVDGSPLPATGYALVPYTNPFGSNETFRTVAWAHGTAGFTRQCAPSNNKVLENHWHAPFTLAKAGYVVIAPDYAGLGSQIPQGFMYEAGIAHAADVSLAIQASRKALHGIVSHEWVVGGHSEGGLTAWRTAQREADADKAAGGFLGAVAIAPGIDVMPTVPYFIERANGGPSGDFPFFFALQSISRLYPSMNLTKYVTKRALSLAPLAHKGCLSIISPLFGNLTIDDQYLNNANYTSAPEVVDWERKYHGKGAYELGGPLLVIQGEIDWLTTHNNSERVFDEQCKEYPKSLAEYVLFPGLDHDGALEASYSTFAAWISDRFNKKAFPQDGCSKRKIKPATNRFTTTEQAWTSGGQVAFR